MQNKHNGCHSYFPQIGHVPVPNDLHELKFIPSLIDKIPTYIKKIDELDKKIDELSKKIAHNEPLFDYKMIKRLIYKAFFIDLENRKYTHITKEEMGNMEAFDYEYRNVKLGEVISNRNVTCEICGENRSTDQCHIIPKKLGGTLNANNILILCPTHHRLFDRFMLSKSEFASINWNLKSKASQQYIESVTLPKHKMYWKQIEEEHYSSIPSYEVESDEWRLYQHTLKELLNFFDNKEMLSKNSVLKVIDENLRGVAKQLITYLLKENILIKDERGKFIILNKPITDLDVIAKKCWQKCN